MTIITTSEPRYKTSLCNLYMDAFGKGDSAQYIDPQWLSEYIESLLMKGYALIILQDEQVAGALIACPLNMDKDTPEPIRIQYEPSECLYLAEMMVSTSFRGTGIGQCLMDEFLKTAPLASYHHAFIRVWEKNIPALNLYLKAGFTPVSTIEQLKKTADGSRNYLMKKIYLHKKLV